MDLIIWLGWPGGACLVGDDSGMAEGLPPYTNAHTHTHARMQVLSHCACCLVGAANAGEYTFQAHCWHQQQDRQLNMHTQTLVWLQAIQTQWTLVAQLAVRQKGKWCRVEGRIDEKWNLSSYCSHVIFPSPPSLYFPLSSSPPPICQSGGHWQMLVCPLRWRRLVFFLLITTQSPT